MSLKCALGIHNWENCKCKDCGKIRDSYHDFTNDCEKCSICGTIVEHQHNWSEDCEKCSKCGKTRENKHNWEQDCEKCSHCGKTRIDMHKMEDGICTICGNGTISIPHGGMKYKVKRIGNQVIMAVNLASTPLSGNCWMYDDNEKNKTEYGLLYDWETAKALAPEGWHLPTKEDWEALMSHFGGNAKVVFEHLKHDSDSGFEGNYGGYRNHHNTYISKAASAHFWSGTEKDTEHAHQFVLSAVSKKAELSIAKKTEGLSIRYFKD